MGYEIYLIIAFVIFVYLLVQILHMQKPAHKDTPSLEEDDAVETMSLLEEKESENKEYTPEDSLHQ